MAPGHNFGAGATRVLTHAVKLRFSGEGEGRRVMAVLKTSFAVSPECQVVRFSYFRCAVLRAFDRVLQAFVQVVFFSLLSVLVMFITYKIA